LFSLKRAEEQARRAASTLDKLNAVPSCSSRRKASIHRHRRAPERTRAQSWEPLTRRKDAFYSAHRTTLTAASDEAVYVFTDRQTTIPSSQGHSCDEPRQGRLRTLRPIPSWVSPNVICQPERDPEIVERALTPADQLFEAAQVVPPRKPSSGDCFERRSRRGRQPRSPTAPRTSSSR
jgi:hypothetical protein